MLLIGLVAMGGYLVTLLSFAMGALGIFTNLPTVLQSLISFFLSFFG